MRKPKKEIIYALAAFWKKDHRTIEGWFYVNDPRLTHPDSLKIINGK